MRFLDLVSQSSHVDTMARTAAGQRLEQTLTLRNWLIGAYIVEFEQGGEDRAAYGPGLMQERARALQNAGYAGLALPRWPAGGFPATAAPGTDRPSGRPHRILGGTVIAFQSAKFLLPEAQATT